MTSIRIEPAGPGDLAMHRAQYDELVIALQEAGFEAEIDPWEQRAVLPFSPEILIHVGEAGAAAKGSSKSRGDYEASCASSDALQRVNHAEW